MVIGEALAETRKAQIAEPLLVALGSGKQLALSCWEQ